MPSRFIVTEEKRKYTYFCIGFDWEPEIVDQIKKIPSADYHAKKKVWYVRITAESVKPVYDLIQDFQFDATQDVLDSIKSRMQKKKGLLELSRATDSSIELPEFPHKPYPFQKAGVEYMIKAKRCFNGDDMGLGKTIQAIIAMETADAYPHIVICPSGVKKKWRKEIKKWIPHRSSAILNDLNFSYHHDIMILNYEVVLKYLVREIRRSDGNHRYKVREQIKRIGLKGITIDESHFCKNNSSKRTQAIKSLSKGVEYRWMLSGTIIENRPKEFITQLQILGRLSDFGGYNNFIKEYCDAEMEWHGHMNIDGSSNLMTLNKKLRQVCMVRRKKEEIESQIPDKLPARKIQVDINTWDDYNVAERNIFEYKDQEYDAKEGETIDLFGGVTTGRHQDAIEIQIVTALRKITAYGKIDGAVKWIRKFLKTGKQLVVFAHHKEVQSKIIKQFPGCARILGGMSTTEKQKNENKFQNGEVSLIVCSMKAANMGIDLFSSHSVLFVELDWTPSTHEQAEDRCHRLGQEDEVQPYYLIGKDTIDEDMYDLLETKREVVDASLDGSENNEDSSILNDLIKRMKDKGKLHIPDDYTGKRIS